MSYVVVVFGSEREAFAPRCLRAFTGSMGSSDFVRDRFTPAALAAEEGARVWSPSAAHYAVFNVGDYTPNDAGELPLTQASDLLHMLFGAPVYIPEACEALAGHYGWHFALPVPSVSLVRPAPVVADVPFAPVPSSASLPLNPRGPIVLTDGTRCTVMGEAPWSLHLDTGARGDWRFCRETGECYGMTHCIPNAVNRVRDVEAPAPAPAAPAPAPAAPAPAAPRFEVRSGLNGTDRNSWGTVIEFDNGRDAGAWVAVQKSSYAANGKSLVIVKVEPSAVAVDWRAREAGRLADGTYTALPGDWQEQIALSYPDHFAHVASSNKRKVAFTESEGSGERDVQKVLTASAYAERFFDCSHAYWGYDKRGGFVCDMLGDSVKPAITPLGDADAMVKVYRDCEGGDAHGCMSCQFDHTPMHPVAVYALGGELAVACLRGWGDDAPDGESSRSLNPSACWSDSGPVLARCLVWIVEGENRQFGRVYGNSDNARVLRTALEAQGFRAGDCYGAKIAKVEAGIHYLMPYLDIGGGCVDDAGDYWKAGGDYGAQRTDGYMEEAEELSYCERCEESYPSDEGGSVQTSRHDWEGWCDDCISSSSFYCSLAGETVSDYCGVDYRAVGSSYRETVASWMVEDNGVEDDCGTYWEDGFVCADCSQGHGPDEAHDWDGRNTGRFHDGEGDALCSHCHNEREGLADAVEAAEAAEAAEAVEIETELELVA